MIDYSIWFRFRENVDEAQGLDVIRAFLRELHSAGGIAGFRLPKNRADRNPTQRLPFQASIEFHDQAQFSAAFTSQAARGIHTGLHGQVMSLVSDFQIEVFEQLTGSE